MKPFEIFVKEERGKSESANTRHENNQEVKPTVCWEERHTLKNWPHPVDPVETCDSRDLLKNPKPPSDFTSEKQIKEACWFDSRSFSSNDGRIPCLSVAISAPTHAAEKARNVSLEGNLELINPAGSWSNLQQNL